MFSWEDQLLFVPFCSLLNSISWLGRFSFHRVSWSFLIKIDELSFGWLWIIHHDSNLLIVTCPIRIVIHGLNFQIVIQPIPNCYSCFKHTDYRLVDSKSKLISRRSSIHHAIRIIWRRWPIAMSRGSFTGNKHCRCNIYPGSIIFISGTHSQQNLRTP